jgi:hypothetical protein
VAHSNGCNFWWDIDELGGVFKWPTQVVDILGAILGNQVGYLSGPLKWWTF